MTDGNIELTRRKILASAGAVGLAGAGAGVGTSALFSDEESFENNTLAAGELDLKVDWEEHYSYPQLYGFDDPTNGLDHGVHRSEPDEGDYVGFPDPEKPQVWIHEDDIPTYMANTSIEAFPDPDDDGVQEMSIEEEEDVVFEYSPCEDGADVDDHFDPTMDGGLRTNNAGTYDEGADDPVRPLIDLEDVKPGDFGELTLSFHLCGNPGYVWLQAANVEESGGAYTEPEQEAEGENAADLAENIQTAWWYDTDGNNVIDESIGEVDVMLAVDTSGSLTGDQVDDLADAANTLASDLTAEADARVGGLAFGGGSVDHFTALADGPVNFSGLTADGNTPMPAALDIAAAELGANARSGAETFVVLFTDGGPNYENKTYSAGDHTVGSEYDGGVTDPSGVVHDSEMDETGGVADSIRSNHRILTVGINDGRQPTGREGESGVPQLSTYLRDEIAGSDGDYFSAEAAAAVSNVLDAIVDAIAMPEEVFHRGTLAEDLSDLSSEDGIPLDASLATDEERECYQPGVNYFVGFAWWLPDDVGNEVQGDAVSFDLGFYTEQCRNNDGSGSAEP